MDRTKLKRFVDLAQERNRLVEELRLTEEALYSIGGLPVNEIVICGKEAFIADRTMSIVYRDDMSKSSVSVPILTPQQTNIVE